MNGCELKMLVAVLSLVWSVGAACAADVANRKMVWAHYVPWFVPENASQMPQRVYDFPQTDVGANPLRDEIRRALDQGVDGFFNDMVAHEGGTTSFWNLRPFLAAAEGTPFQFGICLDRRVSVAHQAKELVRMLSTYGKHPNYARCGDRFVVCAYTYRAWTPEEWRAIRRICADAGYPIHVVANIETPFQAFDEKVFAPYAGLFEGAFHFSIMGCGRTPFKSVETEMREADAFCRKNGAAFMPCLWPGYYGGWLPGRCSYYQPFCGLDTLQRRFDAAQALNNARWLHVTTWNDHDETTLQTRRLATGNPAIVRAMARAFRGEHPAEKTDVVFAYLRENIPGTVLRFEAQRLPSVEKGVVSVAGRLLDENGEIVAGLSERRLADADWTRTEWLVPTTKLSASHVLTPEFVVRLPSETRVVTLPPVFQFTGWLANPETVKVSIHDRRPMMSSFDLAWQDGVLEGSCTFASEAPLKRAVLYRNERPVTAFTPGRPTVLPVFFSGDGWLDLQVANGRIARAVKSFETNGAPHFAWNAQRMTSRLTPTWMKLTARIETEARTKLTFTDNRAVRTFTPRDLVRFGELRCGAGTIRLSSDGTLYDLPPLGLKRGRLFLSVWAAKPAPTDDFWVEFEFADGTFAESKVRQPFATARRPIPMSVVETPVTLDWTSGASGAPDAQVFQAPEAAWPVKETRLVSARVSPFAVRRATFDFSGSPLARPTLPQRQWPMGPFRLTCAFTPLATDGAAHPILSPNGWNEGPSLTLAADGRLVAAFAGGTGEAAFACEAKTAAPLTRGRRVRITLVNDGRTFKLLVDGVEVGVCAVPSVRVYGNCSPSIGAGVNGESPTVGLLHDLAFAGDPNAVLATEELRLAPLFTDGMVFAEDKPVRIFGTGIGAVSATFRGRTANAVSLGGRWRVDLPPGAAGGPFELMVTLGRQTRVLKDVCVGEVYLMAGQSNMQFALARSRVRPTDYVDEPRLRGFAVSRVEPGMDFTSDDGWRTCAASEAARWSTLAYLFGLERVRKTGKFVGVVVCAQGASALRSWLPEDVCTDPDGQIAKADQHGDFTHPIYAAWNGAGFLYAKMFKTVAPFSFSRVVWYQGESDTGPGGARYYAPLFRALVERWRADLRDAALPFTLVQIADLAARDDARWHGVQDAQARAAGAIPHVTLVKSADISTAADIHPPDKSALAKRLSDAQEENE